MHLCVHVRVRVRVRVAWQPSDGAASCVDLASPVLQGVDANTGEAPSDNPRPLAEAEAGAEAEPCYLCLQATGDATPGLGAGVGPTVGAGVGVHVGVVGREYARGRRMAVEAVYLSGRCYHAGCINLWVHRVDKQAP